MKTGKARPKKSSGKINVAVIGVGHLGKEHARICASMPDVNLVAVVDSNAERARSIAGTYGTRTFTDHREVIGMVDAATIVVPTVMHYKIARDLIGAGVSVLVEKPMTASLQEASKLVALARRKGAFLQVGHIERFNPAIQAAKQYLRNPGFIECHRLSPFSFRSVDIDVVFDLMIHDIDIVLDLVGAMPNRIHAAGVSVLGLKEDIANARLEFPNGCVANITASRISAQVMRRTRLFCPDCYISIDLLTRSAQIYRKSPGLPSLDALLASLSPDELKDPRKLLTEKLVKIENIRTEPSEPLRKEIESFIGCLKQGQSPVVTGQHGLRAMKVATEILKQIRRNPLVSKLAHV
jgi:predicted dehydrogenase